MGDGFTLDSPVSWAKPCRASVGLAHGGVLRRRRVGSYEVGHGHVANDTVKCLVIMVYYWVIIVYCWIGSSLLFIVGLGHHYLLLE